MKVDFVIYKFILLIFFTRPTAVGIIAVLLQEWLQY